MKVDRLETHDRYKEFTKQSFDISECCQDLINKRPFGSHAFYIFAHARTDDDGITKRLIWQPRLTKPKAQTNSMLFKAYPNSDNIRICWMIPAREMWDQYKKGNVTHHDITLWSINEFENNRAALEAKEEDDLSDIEIDAIYLDLVKSIKPKPKLLVAS
jgi:hypothetical protein